MSDLDKIRLQLEQMLPEDKYLALIEIRNLITPICYKRGLNCKIGYYLENELTPILISRIENSCNVFSKKIKERINKDKSCRHQRKNNVGQWEDVEGYSVSYKNFPMGHGEKSVILLLCNGLSLYDDEMLAIRWHMGAWGINMNSFEDQRCYDTSRKLYPLISIIQAADGLAASILERTGAEMDEL